MHLGKPVSQIFLLLKFRAWKRAALAALAVISFAGARNANAQLGVNCVNSTTGPSMTIQITNSTTDFNIYPIWAAGVAAKFDQWMSSCFQDKARDIPHQDAAQNNRYPVASQYRMYIACCGTDTKGDPLTNENGIPPGGSVTITLPLYSKLISGDLNPTPSIDKNGFPIIPEFIDWWNGGVTNVFATPVTDGKPPSVLKAHWKADGNGTNLDGSTITDPNVTPPGPVTPKSNTPTCNTGTGGACALHFFHVPNSIGNWEPQQLLESTLGAAGIDASRAPGDLNAKMFIWDPANVDYDISYVNYAYLPAAIIPFGNHLTGTCCGVGWIGSTSTIQTMFQAMDDWRTKILPGQDWDQPMGMGWPSFVDASIPLAKRSSPPATIAHKIPSPLDIFATRGLAFTDNSVYYPAPSASTPIQRMKGLWEQCLTPGKDTSFICGRIKAATALLQANYQNYLDVFNRRKSDTTWSGTWGCTIEAVFPDPTRPQDFEAFLLQKLYGWTPFGAESGCNARANQLADTPGYGPSSATPYQLIKTNFDELQYWFFFKQTDNYGQWTKPAQQNFGQFDPYVPLIHGKEFMNSPYTYAYSVDDGFGNMQADGTGLIISVGGPKGLPDPNNHVTREVHFNFGLSTDVGQTTKVKVSFDSYSRCGAAAEFPSANFLSFIVPQGINATPNSVTNCPIVFHDDQGRFYKFKLRADPTLFPDATIYKATDPNWPSGTQVYDPSTNPPSGINPLFIDCSDNPAGSDQLDWCHTIYPYQQKDTSNAHLPPDYHVQIQGPAQCTKNPSLCPGVPKLPSSPSPK